MTSTQSTTISQRRDRGRVIRSAGSRVRVSMSSLDASLDVASHRQRETAGYQPGPQAGELILDRSGRRNPAAAQRLVEIEQRLEPRQPYLREKVLGVEQG